MEELALHVLDIMQNSLEAGASFIEVVIREDRRKDILSIEVVDNGRGMDEEEVKKALDPFWTTRTTRRVGFGLPLFKAITEHCNGEFSIQSEPGRGTKVSAVMQWSHPDRPPLGDMASTISVFLAGARRLDLAYVHEIDGRTFVLETGYLRKLLGDVSLNHPLVLQWIREHIREGLRKL